MNQPVRAILTAADDPMTMPKTINIHALQKKQFPPFVSVGRIEKAGKDECAILNICGQEFRYFPKNLWIEPAIRLADRWNPDQPNLQRIEILSNWLRENELRFINLPFEHLTTLSSCGDFIKQVIERDSAGGAGTGDDLDSIIQQVDEHFCKDRNRVAIKFICAYRQLETCPLPVAFTIFENVIGEPPLVMRLCKNWAVGERDFASLYLSLSLFHQYSFLKYWGFKDDMADSYVERSEGISVVPETIAWPRDLLHFFSDHALRPQCAMGVFLDTLPSDRMKQQSGSANWGDYILSFETKDQAVVINKIARFIANSRN